MKFLKVFIVVLVLVSLVYLLGPRVNTPKLDMSTSSIVLTLAELDQYITDKETQVEGLKTQ